MSNNTQNAPNYRLDGSNPLSYMGVKPYTPSQFIIRKFTPTVNDGKGYALGTQWLYWNVNNPAQSIQFVLANSAQNVFTWVPLNGGGDQPTLPDHSVVLGAGVPGFKSTGPIATLGAPVVSRGLTSDPMFGVASVSGGGTGLTTVPQYAVMTGGISGEGPLQTVVGLGTAGQVLTSNGLATLPTWQNSGGGMGGGGPIAVQVFTTPGSGTYTPTAGMASCMVEIVGGGAGGGGLTAQVGGAGGGGSGAYSRKLFLAATIGASQPLVVGAGGASASNGTSSTFGTGPLLTAGGGFAGVSGTNGSGGAGGTSSGGDINVPGVFGGTGCNAVDPTTTDVALSGFGGPSFYGGGGLALSASAGNSDGNDAVVYGSGGSGAACSTSSTQTGGAGSVGVIIITEYGPYAIAPIAGTQVNIIVFDTPGSGTYTPTAGMTQCIVECVGGGGGGAGLWNNCGVTAQGGGGSGGYCKALFDAVTIGASQNYAIGAGGDGGNYYLIDHPTGFEGDQTTFGSFLTAGGGDGGLITNGLATGPANGGEGGTAAGGQLNIPGQNGGSSVNVYLPQGNYYMTSSGAGGDTIYGSGGASVAPLSQPTGTYIPGNIGTGYGSGGSGACSGTAVFPPNTAAGGNGASGVIIITEYIAT